MAQYFFIWWIIILFASLALFISGMMKTERREKHLFQFSGFGHEKKTELTEKVRCLGGRVVEGEVC